MRVPTVWTLLLAGALALAGCATPALPPDDAGVAPLPPRERVVIAVIDTGINPYHVAFQSDELWAMSTAAQLPLSRTGNFAARLAADEPMWAGLREGQLYGFEGTRVMGISFATPDAYPILDGNGHGTATAGLAARSAPDALLVAVQVDPSYCLDSAPECVLDPSVAEAMEWVAAQEWIDVVSISMNGLPAKPRVEELEPESARFLAASEEAAERGALIVNAAGNYPVATTTDYLPGPPWVIAVGGSQGAKRGATVVNGKLVDVVANVTEEVASADSVDGTRYSAGTSLGTPIVAGTLAAAMGLMQTPADADPTLVRTALRDALNASATRWSPTDYAPLEQQDPDPVFDWFDPAAPVVLGPAQVGWGHVDASLAPTIAAVALGETAAPSAPPEFSAFMAQYQAQRERAWADAG